MIVYAGIIPNIISKNTYPDEYFYSQLKFCNPDFILAFIESKDPKETSYKFFIGSESSYISDPMLLEHFINSIQEYEVEYLNCELEQKDFIFEKNRFLVDLKSNFKNILVIEIPQESTINSMNELTSILSNICNDSSYKYAFVGMACLSNFLDKNALNYDPFSNGQCESFLENFSIDSGIINTYNSFFLTKNLQNKTGLNIDFLKITYMLVNILYESNLLPFIPQIIYDNTYNGHRLVNIDLFKTINKNEEFSCVEDLCRKILFCHLFKIPLNNNLKLNFKFKSSNGLLIRIKQENNPVYTLFDSNIVLNPDTLIDKLQNIVEKVNIPLSEEILRSSDLEIIFSKKGFKINKITNYELIKEYTDFILETKDKEYIYSINNSDSFLSFLQKLNKIKLADNIIGLYGIKLS